MTRASENRTALCIILFYMRYFPFRLWVASPTSNFGTCYTFNSMHNTEDEDAPRNASLTGIENGMELFR